uniref:PA14 domain-containing protein n=1 Tax=Rhizochromulina marina TaxID=1034831 RepID=A0A7S2WSA3_9STRA|mmetsp:Transcript_32800/g.94851  ORF Transcript_32800/g.94851 Transcript_32800/m.94851 type:complete len:572 (+) Transcript_32800:121-1836(+)
MGRWGLFSVAAAVLGLMAASQPTQEGSAMAGVTRDVALRRLVEYFSALPLSEAESVVQGLPEELRGTGPAAAIVDPRRRKTAMQNRMREFFGAYADPHRKEPVDHSRAYDRFKGRLFPDLAKYNFGLCGTGDPESTVELMDMLTSHVEGTGGIAVVRKGGTAAASRVTPEALLHMLLVSSDICQVRTNIDVEAFNTYSLRATERAPESEEVLDGRSLSEETGYESTIVDGVPDYEDLSEDPAAEYVELYDDEVSSFIYLGFSFPFYDQYYSYVYISSNGFITFEPGTGSACCAGQILPDPGPPNTLIAGWWNDLDPEEEPGEILTLSRPNSFIVHFYNVHHFGGERPVDFQIALMKSGSFEIRHKSIGEPTFDRRARRLEEGTSESTNSTVGYENQDGTLGDVLYKWPPDGDAYSYAFNPEDDRTFVVSPLVLTPLPSTLPSSIPTPVPSPLPTTLPSPGPTAIPTPLSTPNPSVLPTPVPSSPTNVPTHSPTGEPTVSPTHVPTPAPTSPSPTHVPTDECGFEPPSPSPTAAPTVCTATTAPTVTKVKTRRRQYNESETMKSFAKETTCS